MNTQLELENLERATALVEDVEYYQKSIKVLDDSINGIGGTNFPDLKVRWIRERGIIQARLNDKIVEYRMFLNSIR